MALSGHSRNFQAADTYVGLLSWEVKEVPGTLARSLDVKRIAATLATLCLLLTGLTPATAEQAERFVSVIVQGISPAAVEDAVESVGGEVGMELPIVRGSEARVPAGSESYLRSQHGIFNVSSNDPIEFEAATATTNDGQRVQKVAGAHKLWEAGANGQGVTIAILDTGIHASHPDLAGRVVACVDLSHEAAGAANCADTYGHCTFMAGLAAGNGAYSGGKYKGAAPAANLAAIKVAGYDGATDVGHILAGIQWAVAFKDTYNIRVLNLSLGTNSAQDYRLSPLNYAVEQAWLKGITVVVSAGNTGPNGGTIMKPGDDPYVITVGASSDMGTTSTGDDVVAAFSGRGPTTSNGFAKPDLVSPGVHTIGLRSPGSAVDNKYPNSRVDGMYFRGTGTSMSTATVSGVVAQLISANPALTPDMVKARLIAGARDIKTTDPNAAGAGQIDAVGAYGSLANTPQLHQLSTGLGSIELDRGTLRIDVETELGPLALQGEFAPMLNPDAIDPTNPAGLLPWTGSNWTGSNWTASNWTGSNWTGSNWTGSNWTNVSWEGSNWTGSNWTGSNWTASNWTGSNWTGSNWTNVTWDASNWTGSNWTEADWDASNWTGSNWTGSNWTGSNWTGSNWTGSNWTSAWYAVGWD